MPASLRAGPSRSCRSRWAHRTPGSALRVIVPARSWLSKLTSSPHRSRTEARLDRCERRLHALLTCDLLWRRCRRRIPQAELARRRAQAAYTDADQPHRLLSGPDLVEQPQGRLGDLVWLVGWLWQGQLACRRGEVGPADLELYCRARQVIAAQLLGNLGGLLAQRALQRRPVSHITREGGLLRDRLRGALGHNRPVIHTTCAASQVVAMLAEAPRQVSGRPGRDVANRMDAQLSELLGGLWAH